MKDEWVSKALDLATTPADFYSGCRKILRNQSFSLPLGNDLTMTDSGFTKSKLTMLKRLYYNEEHTLAVAELWDRRRKQDKYGSVSVSTYHHLTKADPDKKSKRASVMGPCLLGVSFTYVNKHEVVVDCFYRTTELFKKFPADLVFLRDVIIPHFPGNITTMNFHFANVTCHPMYFVTMLPHLSDPIAELEDLKKLDKYFFNWTVKWTARYLCEEFSRGILKFSQALRVRKDALSRLTPTVLCKTQSYLRSNHPGYRGDYQEKELSDEE